MILAAGAGSRMQPITSGRAKPSLPVLGTPLVSRSARLLASAGIREIVVNLHHHGESIRAALEREIAPGLRFTFSTETQLLGTGGGIGRVADWLAEDGTAIVVNSDFLADFDLPGLLARHQGRGALGTLVVIPPTGPFPGELWTDGAGRVLGFGADPPSADDITGPFEFTGCHLLEPELLRRFPDRVCDSVRDVYPSAISEQRLFADRHEGWWWEFGSLDRFLHGQLQMIHTRRLCEGGEIVETDDGGRAWVASGARIAPGAIVRGIAALGAGARIESEAIVENSILLDGATVLAGARLRRCLVGPHTTVGPGAQFEGLAVAAISTGASGAMTTTGDTAVPPDGCRAEGSLWVREIPLPVFSPPSGSRAGARPPS